MVTPSVLGAAAGAGVALVIGVTVVIYRYYSRNRKAEMLAPPCGRRETSSRNKVLVLTEPISGMASQPQQNFSIFREQPQRTHPGASYSSSPPTATFTPPPCATHHPPLDHLHVRLSLPDVHVGEEKVSPSQSSYSLPTMRRRSPVVSRARSMDARALPPVPRLSISSRSDSQQSAGSCDLPRTPLSPYLRTPSPEAFGSPPADTGRPISPTPCGRPRSLSPLLSPAYSQNSESGPSPGAASPIGAIQPDLYKKKDMIFFHSSDSTDRDGRHGRLHFRLKYDFDKSDLIVHVIEALDLSSLSENGFHDPYIKVTLIPEVDGKQRQTDIRRNCSDPFFNEIFKFPATYEELAEKTLLFQVFDYDRFSRNDVTGEVRVPMSEVDVTTEIEVWSEIVKSNKICIERPEILLSLMYLPSAGRLTVVVLKAANLASPNDKELPDSFVKVSLVCRDKKVKKRKTTLKKGSNNPVWNEALSFDVTEDDLRQCHLLINVVNGHHSNNPLLGSCILGARESEKEAAHWRDMMSNPRKSIAMWHPLHI